MHHGTVLGDANKKQREGEREGERERGREAEREGGRERGMYVYERVSSLTKSPLPQAVP